MTIDRATVDALAYGTVVRLEISGKVLEGPVYGRNGYKAVQGTALREADGSAGEVVTITDHRFRGDGTSYPVYTTKITTGYPEHVLAHGTLTVLREVSR